MLTIDVGNVKNWEELCRMADPENPGETTFTGSTVTLMYYCLGVGIPEITEKNVEDFYVRMKVNDRLFGCLRQRKERKPDAVVEDHPFTIEELRQYIGLKTNASPFTWAKFIKLKTDGIKSDILYDLRRRLNESEEAQ